MPLKSDKKTKKQVEAFKHDEASRQREAMSEREHKA